MVFHFKNGAVDGYFLKVTSALFNINLTLSYVSFTMF